MAFSIHNTVCAKSFQISATRESNTSCRAATAAVPKASKSVPVTFKTSFFHGDNSIATLRTAARTSTTKPASLFIECGGESKIGKLPIPVPAGVDVKIADSVLTVKGKLGELSQEYISDEISITLNDGVISVKKTNEGRKARQLHGLYRSLAYNMVKGVSEGWEKRLNLIGVGYRASMQGKTCVMNLGFSHPVNFEPPPGITIKVEESTKVIVSGADKAEVGNFAAIMRKKRPPEPYKGKGVHYEGEKVLMKEGKKKGK